MNEIHLPLWVSTPLKHPIKEAKAHRGISYFYNSLITGLKPGAKEIKY